MPREMRLMSERILSLTDLPKGFFLSVTDHVMYSQKLGLGGFAMLEGRFETLCRADPSRICVANENGSRLDLDAGGQHGWFVVPSLLDLAGELVARFGEAKIAVSNVLDPAELKIAEALAGRTGLTVAVEDGDTPLVAATAQARTGVVAQDDPVLWALLQEGVQVEAEMWWQVYHHAKKALAADTIVSRRHAGPMIVNEDGTVIGRKDNDDETDVSFLAAPGTVSTQGESAKP
jgi:hypothetical protein